MRRIDQARLGSLALLTLMVLGCGGDQGADADVSPAAQTMSPTGPPAYVTTLGSDTLRVETFDRTADRLEGQLIERNPVTRLVRYSATLDADGRITHFEADESTPPENPQGPEPRNWVVDVTDDVATVTVEAGPGAETIEVPVGAGAIPSLGRGVFAMYVFDQAMRQARAAGAAEHPVELVRPGSTEPNANSVSTVAGDTVAMVTFGMPFLAWPGQAGTLAGTSGRETTFQAETRRGPAIDVTALASEFAARDARGEGLGVPSPAATVQASVGGAAIEIRYAQPAKRGRDIWGGLVPYGEVWRTGANAATQLTTTGDLRLGDLELPTGAYTLWSTYSPDSATLIVNAQTGQWGTMYDGAQDFGQTALSPSPHPAPQERFTISVEETGDGAMLHLDWDQMRYSVTISAM